MVRATPIITALLLVLATTGAMTGVSQPPAEPGQPSCLPGNALENENVRIWFHGFKGFVKVFDNSDENATGLYQYSSGALVEEDADGNAVAKMNLGRAFPQTSGCTIEETEEYVNLTLTITTDVRRTAGGKIGQATAEFAYKFNKTANGAKFDLRVTDWPWQTDDGLLAYAFTVRSATYDMNMAENGVGFSDNATGEPRGHIEWAENATVTYADETQAEANVIADWEEFPNRVDVTLRFVDVDAGYVELDYDPWASMGDWIIIAGRLISLDLVERLVPLDLYRSVRGLIW